MVGPGRADSSRDDPGEGADRVDDVSPAVSPETGIPDSVTPDRVTPDTATRAAVGAARRVLPYSVADRITLWIARAVFFLIAVGLGIHGARAFSTLIPDYEISPYTGITVACAGAIALIVLELLFARSPVRTIAGVTVGLLLGLILSAVFQPVVVVIAKAVVSPSLKPQSFDTLIAFLNLMTTSIFCYFGVTLVVSTRDEFKFIIPYVEFRKEIRSHVPLVLDTSVFIDGRILGLLAAGLFPQRLQIPRFVLDELQRVADSADRSLRERGRRGLEMLREVEKRYWLRVVDFPLERGEEVDAGLLRLSVLHDGRLVTTDHNLTKRAQVQGVPVININDIAAAMKPAFVPGEVMRVRLQRPGDDPGQAVGFLLDGTMVVVDHARESIGQEVTVEVRSALQTNAGKMVFGTLARSSPRASSGRRSEG